MQIGLTPKAYNYGVNPIYKKTIGLAIQQFATFVNQQALRCGTDALAMQIINWNTLVADVLTHLYDARWSLDFSQRIHQVQFINNRTVYYIRTIDSLYIKVLTIII